MTHRPFARSWRRDLAAAGAALALAASTAACGTTFSNAGSGNETTPGRSTGTSYSSSLLAIVAPSQQALAGYDRTARSLGPGSTPAQLDQAVSPVLAAYEMRDNSLLGIDWPSAADTALHDLVDADGILMHDLQTLQHASPAQVTADVAAVKADQQRDEAAAQTLRAHLQGTAAR